MNYKGEIININMSENYCQRCHSPTCLPAFSMVWESTPLCYSHHTLPLSFPRTRESITNFLCIIGEIMRTITKKTGFPIGSGMTTE